MKVSENVEKGGAVLKMVSSSTGFLKGMMELSLAAAASATVGNVNDGSTLSPETDDNVTTSQSRSSNGPSSIQSAVVGSGDKAASRRLGKGLSWLRGRCRRYGVSPSSDERANRSRWRRRDQSTTTNAATHVCSTTASNVIPTNANIVDQTTVPSGNRSRTSLVHGNNNGRQDTAVGGVYEKRAIWLKRCSRITDSDDSCANVNDETGTAPSGFSSDALPEEKVNVSVISDGQSSTVESPSKANAGFESGEPWLNEIGGVQVEVLLDPAALKTTKSPLDNGNLDCQASVAVDHVQSTTTAYPSVLQPQESDMDCCVGDDVHVVASKRPSLIILGSSDTDRDEQCEPSPLSADVDFLCSEIGSLVADYMRQHLVGYSLCDLAGKNLCKIRCKS